MGFLDRDFNQHAPEKVQTVSSERGPISQKVKAVSRHFNRVTRNLMENSWRQSNYPRASRWVTLVPTHVFVLPSHGLWPCCRLAASTLVFSINLELIIYWYFPRALSVWGKYHRYGDFNYFWDPLLQKQICQTSNMILLFLSGEKTGKMDHWMWLSPPSGWYTIFIPHTHQCLVILYSSVFIT